ncbi:hypothetical protein LIER_41280 [Lithospermum erythrorhizon]|uniref:Reverse transcriptase Ty1/copia-type domain-containing protein n=1 Tax=Lithospermum erythrorhizon TaxID=34254 RepID=A0AAV3R6W8_LITER
MSGFMKAYSLLIQSLSKISLVNTNVQEDNNIVSSPVPEIAVQESVPVISSSQKTRKVPQWMDYEVNNCEELGDKVVYSADYAAFLTNLNLGQEPYSYKLDKDKPQWIQIMEAEIQALEINETWDIVDLPANQRSIGCKWVYKIKRKPDGSMDKYKARLVPKGFNQVEGLDL